MKYIIKLYEWEGIVYYFKNTLNDTIDKNKARRFDNLKSAEIILWGSCDKEAQILEVAE